MPLSLLEAMSYGNCCLVSDIPECVEVVEDKAMIFKKSDMIENDHKINKLDIFRFNYHPDEGYYIFDDKYLILGNLKYEMEKKEYTFSKNVMLIDNQTETGRTWIKEYIERFEDTKKNYETSVMQYCDTES